MRTFFYCLIGVIAGYVLGAGVGALGVELFSANTHDKSVEMAMTAAFVTGPIGVVVGLIAGWVRARRSAA